MGATEGQAEAWLTAFGRHLRGLRIERGLSQMELAHRVGLHPTYISGIERGVRNVSLVNIHVLAEGLGVASADLLVD